MNKYILVDDSASKGVPPDEDYMRKNSEIVIYNPLEYIEEDEFNSCNCSPVSQNLRTDEDNLKVVPFNQPQDMITEQAQLQEEDS